MESDQDIGANDLELTSHFGVSLLLIGTGYL